MATATTTTTTATVAAANVTPAGATLATDEVLCDTQPLDTPVAPPPARRYKIELDVCNEYDATLSRTFVFTLPRTRRARRVRARVAKIASRGYTNGNCDRIIRILKPFPCRERVTDDKRMVIRMLSSELEEPWPCHVPVAHDDVLDAEVSDWECDSSSDDEIGA